MYNSVGHFRTESRLCCVGSALYQHLLESHNLPPQESHPKGRLRRPLGGRRSRGGTFTAIRRRGPGVKTRPGAKIGNKNFCFRRTPAVLKACHLCRMRPIKTPLYKTRIPILSYPTKMFYVHTVQEGFLSRNANKDFGRSVIMIASE